MQQRRPCTGRTLDYAVTFHLQEFCLCCCKLLRVKPAEYWRHCLNKKRLILTSFFPSSNILRRFSLKILLQKPATQKLDNFYLLPVRDALHLFLKCVLSSRLMSSKCYNVVTKPVTFCSSLSLLFGQILNIFKKQTYNELIFSFNLAV